MKTYLSLDLSLRETGYIIRKDNKIVRQGVIKIKTLKGIKRVVKICTLLKELVSDFSIDICFIEGGGFNTHRAFSMGELHGAIKYNMSLICDTIVIVPPAVIKKYITGKGNCDKKLIMDMIRVKYGFESDNDNICDAYALLRTGIFATESDDLLAKSIKKKIIIEEII